jgi:anthranilate synthase
MSDATEHYRSAGGIEIHRHTHTVGGATEIDVLTESLDHRCGALFSSSYEYPGRYTRWDFGFVDPPLSITARGRRARVEALNTRGQVLLPAIAEALRRAPALTDLTQDESALACEIVLPSERFPEEQRSRQPSVFSLLRSVLDLFHSPVDPHLGLYGAFGYDLALQFEPVTQRLKRPEEQRDLVLFLPDELLIVDHRRERAHVHRYEFSVAGRSTEDLPRVGESAEYRSAETTERRDHSAQEFADAVRVAQQSFLRGDLFEVVLSQTFSEPSSASPAELFRRLRARNPSPYGFLINLGEAEYLVGASPEMYVRVEGRRVETCPISGTIPRGADPIEDAEQIRRLLNSRKDESELTMCTDVDRNDKSRICEPGSVRVIGRRQIEIYSRLIHTVDHVEGMLRPEFDALDAFLCHTWAVTVTGAPKAWAMQFVEDHERSARAWYGGAVGLLGFDGNMNTGLTLRTIHVRDGVAKVRAGATLLFDSEPEAEEEETRVKASALLDAIVRPDGIAEKRAPVFTEGRGKRILLIDHQDSFVHTLANYLRQTGAEVETWRFGFPPSDLDGAAPDLVVLSPGPGAPSDFDIAGTLGMLLEREIPVFGVCLGLQGIVEALGGELRQLDVPMHGKPSQVRPCGGALFAGLEQPFRAARYHSLFVLREAIPDSLEVTAESEDGVVMAVEHRERKAAAVQFHPESILTGHEVGMRILRNAIRFLTA